MLGIPPAVSAGIPADHWVGGVVFHCGAAGSMGLSCHCDIPPGAMFHCVAAACMFLSASAFCHRIRLSVETEPLSSFFRPFSPFITIEINKRTRVMMLFFFLKLALLPYGSV